ncbi:4-hydroxy-tetrahydrodipicolinate reductase [Clostridium sporogenes]|uniref:4-hydroxy-tetrahydrodipicolinate reductase n=1 Tax=Clostridium sporogenes TaxID=1509 RepID=A0A7U4XTJ9_CLOSG|nr:4-hydroxy-tetrahydrodipicolinate reductase [Clostridium sporogenes]AVP61771.1 4-hydroxy-tetrahydrodipicolinate reductase [Clostridium botulinum]AKC61530.1 4-hydroxy-tetrahydrodipicolinate reductase DapB [Clostridium sporogenes]AKJ88859.1 dihydrodipicolinate reductase [Clostridium sporogenes]EHN15185.1 dihydrodipicolinate reductase [Clostridium sporogenes PA 3679]KCZ68835.1 4-hydroxy-tetrahydrodipicolinate reductase DapB [Clostridium sporogenes]
MKIIVIGPRGKMGSLVTKSCYNNENIELVAAVAPKGRDYIGQDLGIVANLGKNIDCKVVDDLDRVIDKCDCIIDFTEPETSMEVFEKALKNKKSVVCGTTGFSEGEINRINEISKEIPVVLAGNTSMVVNLMYKLVELAANTIGNMSDIEIIEMHDRYKKDAPSGTSLEIGEVLAKTFNKELKELAQFGRYGKGEREEGKIAYHSLRAGDISSSHTVMFGLMGERLEITHHAHNWECFANGGCQAALFLRDKKPGIYSMKDVLGL